MKKEMPSGLPFVRLRATQRDDACVLSAVVTMTPVSEKEIYLLTMPVTGVKLALRQYVKQVNDAPRGKPKGKIPQEILDLVKLKRESSLAVAVHHAYLELEDQQSLQEGNLIDVLKQAVEA